MSKNTAISNKKKRHTNRAKKVGLPPGSLVYFGNKEINTSIDVIQVEEQHYLHKRVSSAREALSYISPDKRTWINCNGLNAIEEMKVFAEYTHLNNLLLEDVLDTEHRPKVELLDEHILVIIKMLYHNQEEQLVSEHVAMLLGKGYLITFQESEGGDVFDPVRRRLENPKERNLSNHNFIMVGLLDAIIDNYFMILDKMSDQIEVIEDEIINNPREDMISEIQLLKKRAIFLQKMIVPSREVVSKLEKSKHSLLLNEAKPYLRDLYDHTIQIVETLGTYRDILWGLTDTYMGAMSNKMNNIMRLLTLISTIFIPLTFIVGVYGMNFEFMPELHYKWAYPAVWAVMVLISLWMLGYFRRKKWL